jgi:hypothetical protein
MLGVLSRKPMALHTQQVFSGLLVHSVREAGGPRTMWPSDGDDVPGQQRVTWQLIPLPLAVHLCAASRAMGAWCFMD